MTDTLLNRQLVLDEAYRRIVQQGKPSIMANGDCRYYLKGKRCAIGQLAPDASFRNSGVFAETLSAGSFFANFAEDMFFLVPEARTSGPLDALTREDKDFLRELQQCHDNAAFNAQAGDGEFVTLYGDRIASLAFGYELTSPVAS
jgi:hypothetical protein